MRRAITFDQPGITRDLVAEPVEYDGRRFLLVDTGGYMTGGDDDLLPKIRGQVLRALYESDLVVFLLAANKGDVKEGREGVPRFPALSVERSFSVSSEQGTGVSDLLEEIVAR